MAALAAMPGENFPVALRFLPAAARRDLTSVYVYARFVDDVGDEAEGDRTARLDAVEADLRGPGRMAPVAGVAALVRAGRVPIEPFLDLVEANRRDQYVTEYESYADLVDYCRYSATPVGRIVLHLAGAADDRNVAASDAVCTALQVLEHCQDVGEDFHRGRVYLPAADLRDAGVPQEDLGRSTTSPALRRAVARQVARARESLAEGAPLVRNLRGWARFAVAGYVAGGLATADALEQAAYDVLGRKVEPASSATIRHAVPLLVGFSR